MRMTLLALIAGATISGPALAEDKVEIRATDLGNGVYMLEGQGGNLGLSVGEDGAFLIDDQFDHIAPAILAKIDELTDQPLRWVINTHWHGDHTGGNEAMHDTGAVIVAHDNVRKRLAEGATRPGRDIPPAPEGALPQLTFSEEMHFHWNGHDIHVFHYPDAHTDGDSLIYFRNLNILHTGDTLFARRYPYIDLASGGTVDGYIANLEKVAALSDDDTQIIPGHGPLSSRADVLASIEMLQGARIAVKEMLDSGMSHGEIMAANPLAPWDEAWSWQFINTARMTETLIKDLTS